MQKFISASNSPTFKCDPVLNLIAKGMSSKIVADELGISPHYQQLQAIGRRSLGTNNTDLGN